MLFVILKSSLDIWSFMIIITTVINIKILTNSNQQIQSYEYTSHIAAFLSVVLVTEMLEICIQTSYDQNVRSLGIMLFVILKSSLDIWSFMIMYNGGFTWKPFFDIFQLKRSKCTS
jgi:hypothetical protein